MPPCYGQAKVPFTSSHTVAVAIDSHRRHLGIYHSSSGNQTRQLHLAFHNDLRWEAVDGQFSCWIRPAISEELAFSVSAFCRLFANEHAQGRVPYGFSSPKGALDRTGHLLPQVVGLTCASLVLALFDLSVPLVDYDTWPIRIEDIDWERHVADRYLSRSLTREELDRLLSEVPSVRFRPLEVATAASADSLPQTHAAIETMITTFRQAAEAAEQP